MAGKKRGRPKSKKKMYFDEEVQNAIVEYNTNPDKHSFRNKVYQEKIHYAFDKLAENIINTFKFTYFDDPFEDEIDEYGTRWTSVVRDYKTNW